MVKRRIESGIWVCVYPRVLTLPSIPETWLGRQMAACLWGFPGFAAGHAAGFLHQLPGCEDPSIEIVTLNRKLVPHTGIKVHVTSRLPEQQRTVVQRVPVTSIERTLMDLCGCMRRDRAAMALDNAMNRSLTTLGALDHLLLMTARKGRNGCGVLRTLLKERTNVKGSPTSPLETLIYEMLVWADLPMPELQVDIYDEHGAFVARPDFTYSDQRLIIEGHSKLWHWGARAESRDLVRHNRLSSLGYKILYVTWDDASRRRDRTAETIRTMLGEGT